MFDTTDLATKKTAADLVEAYNQARILVREAIDIIYKAQGILDEAFGEEAYVDIEIDPARYRTAQETYERTERAMRKPAWRRIVDLSNVTRIMSTKAAEEMRKNMKDPKKLPEISLEEVMGMLETLFGNVNTFAEEAAREVFDFLRPARGKFGQGVYVTNDQNGRYEVGRKVILTGMLEHWTTGKLRVRYGEYWEDKLNAVDRVFHALDGNLREMENANKTPLVDAINTTGWGAGETEYFKFKCYHNGNLHLEFKRLDLLDRLNAIGGRGEELRG